MIEFGKHKDSFCRWGKKFPRAKIRRYGGDKTAVKIVGCLNGNWDDDIYQMDIHYLLNKFLKANLGRPVDKVYSKFLSRCRKSMKSEDLKKFFYNNFHEKDYDERGNYFYVTNGILNYKKKAVKSYKHDNTLWKYQHFNELTFPNKKTIANLCTEAKNNHTLIPIGEFYVYDMYYYEVYKKRVFVATTDDFKNKFFYMKNIYLAHNNACGLNVPEGYEENGSYFSLNHGTYSYLSVTPSFVFLIKSKKI